MRNLFRTIIVLAIGLVAGKSYGFSLTGPLTPWMTTRIGYGGLVWGPMNIGEEYRWTVPTVYYSYSPSFLNFFGQRGVEEVEKAIKVMNDLPSMDTININDYPLSSMRFNYRAQALNIIDLKSYTLNSILWSLGLDDPLAWVYTLRKRWITPDDIANFIVIKRNFDPDTWAHSSYINGELWTYTSILDGPEASTVAVEPVDPLALGGLRNAPVASFTALASYAGAFWTVLTRDDVAGLHYIYRSTNYNLETAPTNALGSTFGGSAGGGGSPWSPVTDGGGIGGIPGATTNFVNAALRPGVGKITFTRVNYDSMLGFFPSNNVAWVDRYVTNSTLRQQTLIRPLQAPDFLFDAADLSLGDDDNGQGSQTIIAFTRLTPQDNANLDGISGPASGGKFGPGQMQASLGVSPGWDTAFSTLGPRFYNVEPFSLSEANATVVWLWGSFDGSTNAPIIYPQRTSIEEVERQVLNAQTGAVGSGGLGGSIVSPWTPVDPPVITTDTGTSTGANQ